MKMHIMVIGQKRKNLNAYDLVCHKYANFKTAHNDIQGTIYNTEKTILQSIMELHVLLLYKLHFFCLKRYKLEKRKT